MKSALLPLLSSPKQLTSLSHEQLNQLAHEIREVLCEIVEDRPAHFASNLGVVELCIALHPVFDFEKDRLIWDTGHQIYPHKLMTGRYAEFDTIRRKGGLMGYPNPAESAYDLFMTGHAGASVSTVLGLKAADDLQDSAERRHAVAVLGDGALPSGVVFEAMNNAAGLNNDLLVILNDNEMGICPRVGGLASYLDKARVAPFYNGLKKDVSWLLNKLPFVGEPTEKMLGQFKDAVKIFLHGGMLFEEMGFRYIGPVDGHDIAGLRRYLELVKDVRGPVLLHVFTEKGHGFGPACDDPVKFHAPAPFTRNDENEITFQGAESARPTRTSSAMRFAGPCSARDDVCVITAAMCAGNNLGQIRDEFPDRFFDTGICEAHAVAFAGGLAKGGLRPIVDIYSTFLQRRIRPSVSGSGPAEASGDLLPGSRRVVWPRWTDSSWRIRQHVHADVSEHRRHGPRRYGGCPADARFRAAALRPDVTALSKGRRRDDRPRSGAHRTRPGGGAPHGSGRNFCRIWSTPAALSRSGRTTPRRGF